MHLNCFVAADADPDWLRLVTAKDVRAVVIQRDAMEAYCSIERAMATHDWGHTPAAHLPKNRNRTSRCDVSSRAARTFEATVPARFNATRTALAAAGRPFLDLPFSQYVADSSSEAARVLAFCGLRQPPPKWRDSCCQPWCKTKRCGWPAASGSNTRAKKNSSEPRPRPLRVGQLRAMGGAGVR